jgi:Type II CAAX prenyl endopeptidase Rce1-like
METTIRVLVALALTLLLVMLRLEAEQFGAAEYDEPINGHRPPFLRRLAWYVLGIGGLAALTIVHPAAGHDLFLTVGERSGVPIALLLGTGGIALAVGEAWFRYHRLRLPDVGAYPGALINEIATAFVDEGIFRGALLGYFLWAIHGAGIAGATGDNLAILGQAFAYVLATRLGAPGRDRYMFLLAIVIGLVGGWATLATGGIGAAFVGHAITRVAVFLTTGHAGQPAARGREVEEVERRRRHPDGWRLVDRSAHDR